MIIDKTKGDVCIIGAGFVGCAAALGLNRLGFSIDLVDKRPKTLFGKMIQGLSFYLTPQKNSYNS